MCPHCQSLRIEIVELSGQGRLYSYSVLHHPRSPGSQRVLGRLRREVTGSRRWLQHAFGAPVDFFAYPSGRYNPAVEAAVRAAGYRGATTTLPGQATRAADPYALPRVRVTPGMSPRQLVATVQGRAGTRLHGE